jgi:Fe2+ transport system protein FeoA
MISDKKLNMNSMNRIIALSDLKPDQQGRVVNIKTKTAQELLKLMAAGIVPDVRVNVLHSDQWHVLFFANYKELALDHEIALGIYVEPDR